MDLHLRPVLFRRCVVSIARTAALVLLAVAAASPCAHAADPDADASKEIRLPFRFVEPSQAIEVFGCSPGGPTHETVIVTLGVML